MNNKRIIVGVLAVAVVLALVVPVVAAGADGRYDELNALFKQLNDLQKQIVQKEADLGIISPDQAKWEIQRLDQIQAYRAQNPNAYGPGAGYGLGAGYYGCPMHGGAAWGWGPGGGNGGRGGMMGGWGWWGPNTNTTPNNAPSSSSGGNI